MEDISAEKLREMIYTVAGGDGVLDLSGKGCGLSKVPEAVTDLTELERLDLSDNLYLKELPTSMNKLKNLKWLELHKNQLKELPHSVCELSNLTLLIVSFNKLRVVPANIKHLKKLRVLWLEHSQLTTLPDEIGELKELGWLTVAGNPLTLEGMRKVMKLQNKMKFLTDVTEQEGKTNDIQELRNKIMEVLRQEPYMGEKIPVRWFLFEKVIEDLIAKQIFHINLVQLQSYAKEHCFIEDTDEFAGMISFYHGLGMIIKHRSTVVLKAQWLIDLLNQLTNQSTL